MNVAAAHRSRSRRHWLVYGALVVSALTSVTATSAASSFREADVGPYDVHIVGSAVVSTTFPKFPLTSKTTMTWTGTVQGLTYSVSSGSLKPGLEPSIVIEGVESPGSMTVSKTHRVSGKNFLGKTVSCSWRDHSRSPITVVLSGQPVDAYEEFGPNPWENVHTLYSIGFDSGYSRGGPTDKQMPACAQTIGVGADSFEVVRLRDGVKGTFGPWGDSIRVLLRTKQRPGGNLQSPLNHLVAGSTFSLALRTKSTRKRKGVTDSVDATERITFTRHKG